MFWPLVIAGFYLNLPHAFLTGLLAPLLSSLLTGMPPVPILYTMMAELSVLTTVISALHRWTKLGSFPIIFTGLLISRIMLYIVMILFGKFLGLSGSRLSIIYVSKSLIGVLFIILLIPLFLLRIKKEPLFWRKNSRVTGP